MKRTLLTFALIAVASAQAQIACLEFNPAERVGTVAHTSLTEVSGIAASRQTPGVIWAHDDSGDVNRLFAMDTAGTHLGMFYLGGITATDWEDMATGPGPNPGQQYLYVADTGNNTLGRETVTIYRVAEPSFEGVPIGAQLTLSAVDALPIQYPNGSEDVETLLVDPQSGDILLLTRDRSVTGFTRVYLYPAEQQTVGQIQTVTHVTTLTSSVEIKGGDVSPAGDWVILRRHATTNAPGWLYYRAAGTPIESIFTTTPCHVAFASEPQGEAVSFTADGSGYFTVSEGAAQPIYYYGPLTAPSTPDGGVATVLSTTSIRLAWTDTANNENGFTIERSADSVSFGPGMLLAPNTGSYTDSGLQLNTTYWYRLTAYNNAGYSTPLLLSATTLAIEPTSPLAPSGLVAAAVSKSRIDLSWTDRSTNEQGFLVERSTDNRRFTQISVLGANVTTFSNTGLAGGKTYYYRIRAYNQAGNSPFSNTGSATTPKK